jgi:hypothetical protein
VDCEVAEPKAHRSEAREGVGDRQREIEKRPAIVGAASFGLGEEHWAEWQQSANRGVLDDGWLVVEYEGRIERVAVGGDKQECNACCQASADRQLSSDTGIHENRL